MALIFLELNEINFDVIKKYISKGYSLPGFSKILKEGILETSSENNYDFLEPWIQWPSVHTGYEYSDHKIFRLGDIVKSDLPQIFEKIENKGFSVGAISPMNARNDLINPAYFVPDPWTNTKSDRSFFSRFLTEALRQSVNENSKSRLSFSSFLTLIFAIIFYVRPFKYFSFTKYAFSAFGKPWRKALFLDKLLYEVHRTLFKRKGPDFSTIFLNAGAHIQHHYFFNSSVSEENKLINPEWYVNKDIDPILEMLQEYDQILQDLLSIKKTSIVIATGLSQKPFTKVQFYYRLLKHEEFLKKMEISFKEVYPRMTRDFLITFESEYSANLAEKKLKRILVNNNHKLFGEIDNRGKELFVVLTYPNEIKFDTFISINGKTLKLKPFVVFVAVKNGMHDQKGYLYLSKDLEKFKPENNQHVSKIHFSIIDYFNNKLSS